MHNSERDDVEKALILPEDDSDNAADLLKAVEKLNLHIEQRRPGKPIVCEVIGSDPLELVVVIPGDKGSYTLQALRPLAEGEPIVLRRRGGKDVIHAMLYHCRKAQRGEDHPKLHLAGLKITEGTL